MAIRNNLDDIVNVDIEISTPGSSDESFNNVLLVVEGPVVGKKSTDNIGTKVISVAQTGELADYGFSTESQAYIMANVAFSQSPKPSLVYVIARQVVSDESDPVTYEKISVTLDRAKEAGGWYGIALSKHFLIKQILKKQSNGQKPIRRSLDLHLLSRLCQLAQRIISAALLSMEVVFLMLRKHRTKIIIFRWQ